LTEKTKNSRKINGFWISEDQIKFWEEAYSGTLVEEPKTNAILQAALKEYVKSGKEPGPMRIRELYPFSWFIPIRIDAEIIGLGVPVIPTNRFIFLKVRKVI